MNNLNPKIKATVEWLRQNGFNTTDSGDGETHDFECDQNIPYVHMVVKPEVLIYETRRLVNWLTEKGVKLEPQNETGKAQTVEACFSPLDGIATISLYNVML